VKKWSKFEIIWFIFVTALITLTVTIKSNGVVSNLASIFGVIGTFLIAKQTRLAYIFTTINALLYGWVVYKNGMYGSAIYNFLYNFPMQIYGIIYWTKSANKGDLGIKTVALKTKIISTVILTIIICITMIILDKLGGSYVLWDSIIMVLSYVAVFLMTNKYMEQWLVWIIVNVSGTIMWGMQTIQDLNNLGLLVMWAIFLCNSIYGFINWRKLQNSLAQMT